MPEPLGLRFTKRDGPLLRSLAESVRNGELGSQAVAVFENAASAAENGEPLIVHHDDPSEVAEMAAAYAKHGVSRPVIEQLSGA
jgi:hypothetical protein